MGGIPGPLILLGFWAFTGSIALALTLWWDKEESMKWRLPELVAVNFITGPYALYTILLQVAIETLWRDE